MPKSPKAFSLVVSLIGWAASGCIPATVTEIPAVSGRVVDSHGGPVSGATIDILPGKEFRSAARPTRLISDRDGRFHADEQYRWGLAFPLLAADAVGPGFTVQASKDGLRSDTKTSRAGILQTRWFGVVGFFPKLDAGRFVLQPGAGYSE